MRTLTFDHCGEPLEVLRLSEVAKPTPGDGEVRVRVSLASIHNHDMTYIRGIYATRPTSPSGSGSEAVGVIDALGHGVSGLKVGQRVTFFNSPGAWGELCNAKADRVVPIPDHINDAAACQLLAMPMSALLLLDAAALSDGQWMVQNAANGAVGKAVAMIAKARGIKVLNIVRRTAAVGELAALGIDHTVASDQPDWMDRARAIAGRAPIVFGVDSIAGEAAGDLLGLLSDGGRFVSFGALSHKPLVLDRRDLIFRNKTVSGFMVLSYKPKSAKTDLRSIAKEISRLITAGTLKLTVDKTYALDDYKTALEAHVKPGRTAKSVFKP